MKILVTGGTGLIGKPLVRALAMNNDVTVFSRTEDVDRPDNVNFVAGDVTKKHTLRKMFTKFDVVYHLAAINDEEDPELWETNVTGTQKVVEYAKEKGVKQLIFISYAGVLGESRTPEREHSRYAPKTKFDKSKAEAERIIKNSGLNYTIIRVPAVLGASVKWEKIFEAVKNGHPITGHGNNKFHLVHVDDVVRMLLHVLDNKKAIDHIFNLASKDVMTYGEFHELVRKSMRAKSPIKYQDAKMANLISGVHWLTTAIKAQPTSPQLSKSFIDLSTRNCFLSIQKAKDVLGFEPYYTTPAAIDLAIKEIKGKA
jgi:nucleoside-diphosphate-sugar epimerase